MALIAINSYLLTKHPNFPPSNDQTSSYHFNFNAYTYPINSLALSLCYTPLTRYNSLYYNRVVNSKASSSQNHPFKNHHQPLQELLFLLIFSVSLLLLRLLSNALLPDFPLRWRNLVAFARQSEVKTRAYPSHLWQAIVAYEDRRFFSHFGVDPVGVSRAVLSFSSLGGGSTITQQLVKNTFLKNERTVSRKIVEMVLALAMERVISKWEILSSYMSKIYWGHGIHGIESASVFYFRKHPSLLSLGESALLAGLIPAPELRSPFRDCSRGKIFQARVLKRMVEVGFIDVGTALLIMKEPLQLHVDGLTNADELLYLLSFSREGLRGFNELNQACTESTMKDIWDWEQESKIWEAREDMKRWANNKVPQGAPSKTSDLK